MSKLITDEQKVEIEILSEEHFDALVAYGADLYRKGMFKGFAIGLGGFLIGSAIGDGVMLLMKHIDKQKN